MTPRLRPKYVTYRVIEDPVEAKDQPTITVGKLILSATPMPSTDPENTNSPFILMPKKDPAAFRALICYANFCEPELRDEIGRFLMKIAQDEPELGTQGARNLKEILIKEMYLGIPE